MTTTTYTIDAFLSTQSDESDPNPYFTMTANNTNDFAMLLCEMICDDFDDVLDVVLRYKFDDDLRTTAYDIVAIRSVDRHDDDVIGVAYVESMTD